MPDFAKKLSDGTVPPFAIDPEKLTSREGRAQHVTTNNYYFQGLPGSRVKPVRVSTTNRFGKEWLEDRSMMRQAHRTPSVSHYARHSVPIHSQHRRHHPHTDLKYPLEPQKAYPLWKPKIDEDPELIKQRAAVYFQPNMIRRDNPMLSNWVTTTYKDFFYSPQQAVESLVGKAKQRGSFPQFPSIAEEGKPPSTMQQRNTELKPPSQIQMRSGLDQRRHSSLAEHRVQPATADATPAYRTSTAYKNYHNQTWGHLQPKNSGARYSWENPVNLKEE